MLKKLFSAMMMTMILMTASGMSVYARANDENAKKDVVKREDQTETKENKDWSSIIKAKSKSGDAKLSGKQTRAEFEKQKAQGKNFSTTGKVLIGVGVAAAVIVVVALAFRKGTEDAASFR